MATQMDNKPLLVAAVDFGTTYSGYAFSLTSDFESSPTKVTAKQWNSDSNISHKAPTCVLIEKDGKTARAFGYDAESSYYDDPEKDSLYLFKHFKMLLDVESGLNKDLTVKDVQGRTLPAMTVFSQSIRILKDDFDNLLRIQHGCVLKPSEILWVMTVPAIWNDAAKQFMREAATQAGIPDEQLRIALEPEAAALFCRHLPHAKFVGTYANLSALPKGTQYMVLDAGGGTVDITIHEVMDDKTVKEVEAASGGPWGGVTVDKEYYDFLEKITGPGFLDRLREGMYEDEFEIVQRFEVQKRNIRSNQTTPVRVRIPLPSFDEICNELFKEDFAARLKKAELGEKVTLKRDLLSVHADIFITFFQPAIKKITNRITELLKKPTLNNCKHIIMVGGFSESNVLQEAIKEACQDQTVIIPSEAGLMVLKGAVVFGHDPSVISQRISKYTYGTGVVPIDPECPEQLLFLPLFVLGPRAFCPIVKAGDILKVGHPSEPLGISPLFQDQTELLIKLYAIKGDPPKLVTDAGCRFVGEIKVNMETSSEGRKSVQVQVILGGTELQVQCKYVNTGKITQTFINFLG